jgi:hypothetical protein
MALSFLKLILPGSGAITGRPEGADWDFSAKPIFCSSAERGNTLVVNFKVINRGREEIEVKRWGVRTTNLQVLWEAAFKLERVSVRGGAICEASEEIPEEVAKALMTGAEAFCENNAGVVTRPLIVPVVPLGRRVPAAF